MQHKKYIDQLVENASNSKCLKLKASAIIINKFSGEVLAEGCNEVLPNLKSCESFWHNYYATVNSHLSFSEWCTTDDFKHKHKEWCKTHEIHAETLAMSNIARDDHKQYIMYSLYSPCENCALAIIFKNIKLVYYLHEYKHGKKALDTLKNNGVQCVCFDINYKTTS